MFTCIVCHFDNLEMDDVEIMGKEGRCVCLRCYARLAENEKPMGNKLRRDLTTTLNEVA